MSPKRFLLLSLAFAASVEAQAPEAVLRGRTLPDDSRDFCYEVNRPWVDSNPIRGSSGWNSEYVEAHDRVAQRLHRILREGAAPPEATRFMQKFEDMAQRDRIGIAALKADLDAIEALRAPADIARLIARFNRSHGDPLLGLGSPTPTPFFTKVWPDPVDARRQTVQLLQGGLGLPGTSYYLGDQPAMLEVRARYLSFVTRVLELSGTDDPEGAAQRALRLESALAHLQADMVQLQAAAGRDRRFTLEQLERYAPSFDWRAFFREARLQVSAGIITPQAEFIRSATELLSTSRLEDLRAYFKWQLLRRYSMFLSRPYFEAATDFFSKVLQGSQSAPELSQMAEEFTAIYLPEELSEAYLKRYVSPSSRQKAMEIAEAIRESYRGRIRNSSWLSERSRNEAQRKLDQLEIGVLYPEPKRRSSKLQVKEMSLVGSLVSLNQRAYDEDVRRLHSPTDRRQWWESPISVSGSYSASQNALIIAAGRALPPLFDPEAGDPANYGGFGTLIGHEMAHALDNQGSQYDADGNHRDWWSPEDRSEFERRSERLIQQYGKYSPLPGLGLNGRAELSENIADLSGLMIAYDALKRTHETRGAPLTDTDQRQFFQAWAKRWRVQYERATLVRILTADTHPPLQYRCTVPLSNFSRFYDVIGIEANSPAYVPPSERISIW